MSLEKELENARQIHKQFDRIRILIQCVSLYDLGEDSGYAASFLGEAELLEDFGTDWCETANDIPRTAHGATATEAVQKAIQKCEAELKVYVKKNFRYSPEIQKEFA